MLDRIIKFSIQNKIIIVILTLMLIVWGVWSVSKLSVDAVPDITNNQVQIITVCPSLAGQEVEQLVTFPIEQSIANIPDIVETRSISRFGLSLITVVFKENVNIYLARQLLNEKLQHIANEIPDRIGKPELAPVSTGLGEVYQYIIHPKKGSKNKYSAMDLRTLQDWIVARQLYGTKGIAEVNSFGGEVKQYEVSIDPFRLKSNNISIVDVFNALALNNQNTGGAYIEKNSNAYFIRGIGMVNGFDDINNIVVKNNNGIPIFIKDIATTRYGHAIKYGALSYNGEVEAVGGVVMMLKGENSNEVVKRIKEKIPTIQKSLPDDVIIEPFLDRTDLVHRAIKTVEKNLIEGALIVIFVLVLFLGNLRAGLIVASAIPLSLLFALSFMHVFGISANLMSLGAIDFGLIVDGAVIIVEATLHHLGLRKSVGRLNQKQMDEEIFLAASKIRHSAAFGEIIILIVYIPILTLVGIEGKMFKPMAQTVSLAIIGALILSLTYIPMMCAWFLTKSVSHKKSFSDRMVEKIYQYYRPLLEKALKVKYQIVALSIVIFSISIFTFSRMGAEFIPQIKEGDYAFHCILPQGSSLTQSIKTSMQVSRILKQFQEVKMVVGKTGSAEVPTDPMPPEVSDIIIILKPQHEWVSKLSYNDLADKMMHKLEEIPGIFFEKNQPIQMRFNELMTGVRQDVAVKIFGENMDSLALYAQKASNLIKSTKGISSPQIEKTEGLPQINITYDRNRIANYGLNINTINDIVSTAFAGKKAGEVYEDERRFDLVVRLDTAYRKDIENVKNLMIPINENTQIPLSQIANVDYKVGLAQISREGGKRRIVIGFNTTNRDVQTVVNEIQNKLNTQLKLPTGYYFTFGGQFENLKDASQRLLIAVPIALLLIFVLLFLTFSSFKQALLIFSAIPMSAIGGIWALFIRDMPFSISAGVGFIALFGVAVLNGIVLIGTLNQLEKEGESNIIQRVFNATKIRMRPVLMTAAVASFGFLPMAISTTAGAEVQKPLATVVIGGLISATLLTLFLLPLLYIIFDSFKFKKLKSTKPLTIPLFIVFLVCSTTNAIAQIPQSQNVQSLIEIALNNNQNSIANQSLLKSKRVLTPSAFELPRLQLTTQRGQYNSLQQDQSYQINQAIPFPTLFTSQHKKIQSEISLEEFSTALWENQLKKDVRYYYYTLEYLLQTQKKLIYLDSLYNDFIRIAQIRFEAGDIKKIEINTAETQRGEIVLSLNQNKINISNAYRELQILINTKDSINLSFNSTYIPIDENIGYDTTQFIIHPLVQSLIQEANIIKQNKNIELSQILPEFSLAYTNQSLIGFQNINGQEKYFGANNRFSFASFSIAIPLTFQANIARINSLKYQKIAIEQKANYQMQQLNKQYLSEVEQYKQDLYQYLYYKDKAILNANDIVKAAYVGYKTGDISYIEYLYALQTATNIELKHLLSIYQLNKTIINLKSLQNN